MAQRFPRLKSGTALEPYHLNVVYAELDRWRKMKFVGRAAATGIDSAEAPPVVTVLGGGSPVTIAVTASTITARSGTTAGTGTAKIQDFDSNSRALTNSAADAVTIYNFSGTAGGIASGKYCSLMRDAGGNYWVVSVEC